MKWDDFVKTFGGSKDEPTIFAQAKMSVGDGHYRLVSHHCLAEVYAITLGILHGEDFNYWIQASRRFTEHVTFVNKQVFDNLEYDSASLRAIEKIQEIYGPEQKLTEILAEQLGHLSVSHHLIGAYSPSASNFSVSYGGRHYIVTVHDDTYEYQTRQVEILDNWIRENPKHEKIETMQAKLDKLLEQLSVTGRRP